nr:heavy metal-associated domain-containing protein [uncultured Prevotella sp.]
MKKAIFTMLMLMVAMVATAKDIKTVIFTTTPQMHCANCEAKVKNNLRFAKGVKEIKTSVEEQKVYVTYDAQKTNEEKLQKAFEKFGYKAEKTTKEAKIPVHENEECDNM